MNEHTRIINILEKFKNISIFMQILIYLIKSFCVFHFSIVILYYYTFEQTCKVVSI